MSELGWAVGVAVGHLGFLSVLKLGLGQMGVNRDAVVEAGLLDWRQIAGAMKERVEHEGFWRGRLGGFGWL